MDFGWTSLCLPATDLERSQRFYEACGMTVQEHLPGVRLVMQNGPFHLSLMTFLEKPLLNWRGGDAFEIHRSVTAAAPNAPGEPKRYHADEPEHQADAAGACWFTLDPDGHEIFFDTNLLESDEPGRADRIRRILDEAEHALQQAGAAPECIEALRREVITPFTQPVEQR